MLDGGTPAPNTNPVLIFRQGAGHVQPNSRAESGPGATTRSFGDWLSFLCGAQPGGGCTGVTPMDPSNLNQASIAIGDLAGVQTVKRRVTNVTGGPLTVNASLTGMAGFTVVVSPSTLTLARGQTKEFTVSFTRTTATLNAYTGGQLTWTGGGYNVRSPIVVRPVALAAPTGSVERVVPGDLRLQRAVHGHGTRPRAGGPHARDSGRRSDGRRLLDPNGTESAPLIPVAVPAGPTYARFSLFDADVSAGATSTCACSTPLERWSVAAAKADLGRGGERPQSRAGHLHVVVHGWGLPTGTSPFKLHTWLLGSTAAGNMTVTAPATAEIGMTGKSSLQPAA